MNKNFYLAYVIDYIIGDISKSRININYLKKINSNKSIYIIDLSYFLLRSPKKNFFSIKPKNIIFIQPKNLIELVNFFKKKKKIYAIGPVMGNLNSIYAHFLMRVLNVKLILINYWGFFLNVDMSKKKFFKQSIRSKLKYFVNIKLFYYFYRILSILSLFPKIYFYFETSQKKIESLKKTLGFKFNEKFNTNLFKYYLNIKRINSGFYDEILQKKINFLDDKFIVLVDSGYIDHPDYTLRSYDHPNKIEFRREQHYSKLFNTLSYIKKNTKKNVVFCMHPKVNYNFECIKNYKKKFIFARGLTEKYILRSHIVVFTGGSSLINMAILQKKKILYLLEMDDIYSRQLVSSLTNTIRIKVIFLTNEIKINFKKLDMELSRKLNLYDKFIEENLVHEKNLFSFSQIKKSLETIS